VCPVETFNTRWSLAPPRYHNVARHFFKEKGFKHVVLLSADGALEAAPAMGSADIILDLVSTGRLGMEGTRKGRAM
jgi:ATP phosphoribosyltransferase